MSKLYNAYVGSIDLHHWIQDGEPITVAGTPMVRLAHDHIVPATGWRATKSEALIDAADKMDAMRSRLLAESIKLREQAREASNG